MRKKSHVFLSLAALSMAVLAAFTNPLLAQPSDPGVLVLTVELTGSGDDVRLAGPPEGLTPGGASILAADNAELRVSCANGADCREVGVVLGDQEVDPASESRERATFELSGMSTGDRLLVNHGDVALVATRLQVPASNRRGADDEGGGDATLGEMVLNPCRDRPATTNPAVGYYREDNLMVVRVSPTGQVLSAPLENMDENDQLVVHVLADSRLGPHLNVKRKSAIRTVGSFNIVGAGETIQLPSGDQQNARLIESFPCEDFKFVLDDFASGTGEVEISVLDAQGEQSLVRSFDFVVHKLYHGMFSFGALRSDISDKAFSLAPQGEEKIIVVSEDGGDETFYSVLFTPFVWGPRDIEKRPRAFYHRLNPTFGVTLDEFSDNALFGLSLDLGAFVFTGGVHFARVLDLSDDAGLEPGDPFEGEAAEIPTTKSWERGTFIGVSIDMRAAVQLLQTLVSGAGE